jgi:hypothetical protein
MGRVHEGIILNDHPPEFHGAEQSPSDIWVRIRAGIFLGVGKGGYVFSVGGVRSLAEWNAQWHCRQPLHAAV